VLSVAGISAGREYCPAELPRCAGPPNRPGWALSGHLPGGRRLRFRDFPERTVGPGPDRLLERPPWVYRGPSDPPTAGSPRPL